MRGHIRRRGEKSWEIKFDLGRDPLTCRRKTRYQSFKRWQDVDIDNAKLRVERSLEETQAKGLRFKSPKTKHGRRTISLPAAAVAEIRKHRKTQQEQRRALGLGKAPADVGFPDLGGRGSPSRQPH